MAAILSRGRWVKWALDHYIDVIMTTMASQITSHTVVYWTVHSDADKKNMKAPRHWPLCGEITGTGEFRAQRANVEMFPFDDVIMWLGIEYTVDELRTMEELKGDRELWKSLLSHPHKICHLKSSGSRTYLIRLTWLFYPADLWPMQYVVRMRNYTTVCHPDDLADVGISFAYMLPFLSHPNEIGNFRNSRWSLSASVIYHIGPCVTFISYMKPMSLEHYHIKAMQTILPFPCKIFFHLDENFMEMRFIGSDNGLMPKGGRPL